VLVVTARLTVDPDRIDEFELLARQLWEETHRREPGCRRYEYVRLPERGHYLTLMTFDDHDAFLAHQSSVHHTDIAAGPMRALVTSIALEFGATVDGASGTVDGPGSEPLDVDPPLREHYAARYPAPDFGAWA
jgi:quinol monooxygenase YgiN